MRSALSRACQFGIVLLTGLPLLGLASRLPPSGEHGTVSSVETVVLLHGLGRSARNMLILKWRLQARGYRVCNVDYDTRVRSLDQAADAVHDSLRACVQADSRIHFVSHSLGGLGLRALLDRHPVQHILLLQYPAQLCMLYGMTIVMGTMRYTTNAQQMAA